MELLDHQVATLTGIEELSGNVTVPEELQEYRYIHPILMFLQKKKIKPKRHQCLLANSLRRCVVTCHGFERVGVSNTTHTLVQISINTLL